MIAGVENRLGQASTDSAVGENRCAVADSIWPMTTHAPAEVSIFIPNSRYTHSYLAQTAIKIAAIRVQVSSFG
jgi:hypothetical protein